jgi:hypothetical protein
MTARKEKASDDKKVEIKVTVNRKKDLSEPIKKVEPRRYFKCHFCEEKAYEINSKDDPTSSWCKKCGKCTPIEGWFLEE